MAFIHAGGTVVKKKLNNERLRVDTGCIVAFTSGIDYNIENAGGRQKGEGSILGGLGNLIDDDNW